MLHATSDLKRTLENVRQLLAPQGMLLLLEGNRPQRWVNLVFGLTEGWWKFTDRQLRPSYPLLSGNKWRALLEEAGFRDVDTRATDGDEQRSPQSLILARGPHNARHFSSGEANGYWLIYADRTGLGAELAAAISREGESAILVYASETFDAIAPAPILSESRRTPRITADCWTCWRRTTTPAPARCISESG